MALPTAPLGQLPSMNMPYAIPTYEKGPSIWEKALSAFLVNAVADTASTAAKNLLTRDEASTFGEKNATGFGRLLGPNVTKDEAMQRRQQSFTAGESEKGRAADRDALELRLLAQQGQSDADAANALLRQDNQIQAGLDEQNLRDTNSAMRLDREIASTRAAEGARGAQADKEIAAAQELEKLRALLRAQDPGNVAQAKRDEAAAAELQAKADFNRKFFGDLGGGNVQPGTGPLKAASTSANVDPSIAAFAQKSAAGEVPARPNATLEMLSRYVPTPGAGMLPIQQPTTSASPGTAAPYSDANLVAPPEELPDPNSVLSILRELFKDRSDPNTRINPS